MGCLFLLITLLSPRLGIIVLWLFTDYVTRAFSLWLWPLLGLVSFALDYADLHSGSRARGWHPLLGWLMVAC